MTHDFSTVELRQTMEQISRLNLEIQRDHLPHKRFERSLSKCGCSFRSGNDGVYDKDHRPLPSNHLRMNDFARKTERDQAILSFHDRLMDVSCLYQGSSRIMLDFGLTNAGNAAIDIRFDGISVHERPVTAKSLAPKIVELADCLSRSTQTVSQVQPVRRFMVNFTDRMTAVSPGQAFWKWICLRHRKQALRLLTQPVDDALPKTEEFRALMRRTPVHEVFDGASELAQALDLACPEDFIGERDGLW